MFKVTGNFEVLELMNMYHHTRVCFFSMGTPPSNTNTGFIL